MSYTRDKFRHRTAIYRPVSMHYTQGSVVLCERWSVRQKGGGADLLRMLRRHAHVDKYNPGTRTDACRASWIFSGYIPRYHFLGLSANSTVTFARYLSMYTMSRSCWGQTRMGRTLSVTRFPSTRRTNCSSWELPTRKTTVSPR